VGHHDASNGYVKIRVEYRPYYAHRLAWFYMTKQWPDYDIDHINTIKTDNRFVNLREATRSQNVANRSFNKNNKLGVKGVVKTKTGRFEARIRVNGKKQFLGTFKTVEAAASVYAAKAKEAFGEFARAA
jgi:hypothetical protein